ncbi:unnamed protein product [Menidia menidia]|uniref:(Atlantic silverside) hypothetical protein n=1 Tax=Menidia menidia TaxID=238744 RepID=A0A8S4AWJ3_9TELE|nr:unnamed protein product [Menidia menidia]
MSGKNSKSRYTIQTQLRPGLQAATAASGEPSAPAEVASTHANLDTTALKLELLAALRKDIADIFKKQLQATLEDALSTIKLDLQAVKTELASDKAATDATMSKLKEPHSCLEVRISPRPVPRNRRGPPPDRRARHCHTCSSL